MNKNEIVSVLENRLARSRAYDEPISISNVEVEMVIKALKNTDSDDKCLTLPQKKYYSVSYGQVEVYSAFEIEEMLRKNQILFRK